MIPHLNASFQDVFWTWGDAGFRSDRFLPMDKKSASSEFYRLEALFYSEMELR